MKNIKIFACLAIFLLSAAVSTAWAKDVALTYKISVRGTIPHAYITNADGKTVCDWRNGLGTLWPANEGHSMNDDYKITFRPNQELDKTGTNENNESASTTAFRTEENTIFTVSVGQGYYFKSVTFKEDNTEKASSSNIAPNSTSISVSVPKNKFFNYITVVLTTDFHYSLSYDENLTVSPSPSMTYNNIPYYAAGQTVTFGFSGSGSVKYFVNGVRIEGNSVTVRKNLDVQIGVPYIDENGKEQIREPGEFTVLTSTTDVSNLPGGWYVVQSEVKYTSQVKFNGEAHLILADGAEMTIESESMYGIYASNNLTIYGQSEQSGTLKVTATGTGGYGIYSRGNITIIGGTVEATGDYGIYSYKGVTINGGSVTVTGNSHQGIESEGNITISGGSVTVTGKDYCIYGSNGVTIIGGSVTASGTNGFGIYGYKGVTIKGGTVEASGSSYGIYSRGTVTIIGGKVEATSYYGIDGYNGITLGWTNSTDYIYASGYYSENGISIAEGKSFKDDKDNVYSGTLTGEQLSAIKGKKLEPCYVVTFDAQNGDDPIMLPATFDENGVAHVKKPNDPIRSGYTFAGWFTTADGGTEFDFSAAITGNTTAYAKWSVPYIDEKGKTQIRKPGEYTVLTSLTDVSNLGGGWYVVQGKVKYSNQVKFSGDAHLILADGAEMEIETESIYGIYASNDLTIYGQNGQSDQSGTLKVTATGSGIYSRGNITIIGGTVSATGEDYGIYGYNGVTINGGTVSATGTSFYGIYCYSGDITINGGMVEATGKSGQGINTYTGDITINGGSVTATSDYGFGIYGDNGVTISGGKVEASGSSYGIYSYSGDITINGGSVEASSKNGDGIYSEIGHITLGWTNSTDFIKSSYYSKNGISIAEGKYFTDENGRVYSGTLSSNQIAAISHQTIEPLPWKNLGDYAAVQIFEDENGKKHAVIDGEYEGTETVDIPNEIAVDAVDYIRNFDANTPSTVLMPVRLPSCATVNAKFYKLDEVYQSGYRWVAKVQYIGKALPQANTAYAVMMPTAGKLEFNFEGCATAENKQAIVQTGEIQTSGNTDGSWYFTGTYAFKRWTETENKDEVGLVYGFAGSNEDGIAKGQFGRVDYSAEINPLRCYLRKQDKSVVLKTQTQMLAKAAPQVLKAAPYSISLLPETIDVEFVDDDENGEHTTAIGRMDSRTGKIRLLRTDRTYDLKGRRVNDVKRAAKGAYYGKKF